MNKMTSAVPKDLLPSIGAVTINYRMLKLYLELGIWILIGIEKNQAIGKIITSNNSHRRLTKIIGSLHKALCVDHQAVTEFENLLTNIDKIIENRNMIIHDILGGGKDGTAFMYKSGVPSTKGLKEKTNHLSKEAIEEIADSISEAAFNLQQQIFTPEFKSLAKLSE